MSVLEVNTEHISNTFGDEYDSYVQSDNSSYHAAIKIIQDLVPVNFTLHGSISAPELTLTGYLPACRTAAPPDQVSCKRFILNCSFLI